jgi:aspartyl-tRNA(Asn)/glutamyl-tRNA(Gln) amidotransferase subunit B
LSYQVVIGLEIHVQLKTKSKIFCGCSTEFGKEPNTSTCPVCLGLPGVLPVLNKKALEYTIRTGLALNCRIAPFSKFARKNYFYPDLPKNFQISQYEHPICKDGFLEILFEEKIERIGIKRIHLEEDAGKLVHPTENLTQAERSFVDYNRTGIPLMEIVTEPQLTSPAMTYEFLVSLKKILTYLEVSDCNMEEGSLRCDVNISLSPDGSLGVKTEIKNLNSFRNVEKALSYEVSRQKRLLERGEKIVHETRLWNEVLQRTEGMRNKEEVHDYRYFPEPDLPPVVIDEKWVEEIKKELLELPWEKERRFISQYRLPPVLAHLLTEERKLADYFEACVAEYGKPEKIAHWLTGELFARLNEHNLSIEKCLIKPSQLVQLLKLVDEGKISHKIAKEVFGEMFKTGQNAEKIIKEKNLGQISSQADLLKIIQEVMTENPEVVAKIKKGKKQSIAFLIGQIMKKTRGQANPQLANQLLAQLLEK